MRLPRALSTRRSRDRARLELELLEDRNAPDNLLPLAFNDLFNFNEDETFDLFAPGVLGNDIDLDNDPLTAVLVDGPAVGTLTFNPNGSFTYEPPENFHGQVTFTYRAFDGIGYSELATVTLLISPLNDNPLAVDDFASTDEDTPITISALANDSDVDGDALSITGHSGASHGSVTQNAGGTFTYTPNAGWSGEDSFTYTISDPSGATDTATVNVTVNQVGPAFDDVAWTDEEVAVDINVLENDEPAEEGSLDVIDASDGAHGTVEVNLDDTLTYTPELNFFGEDHFTYTVFDEETEDTDTATVWLTIYPVNDMPTAVTDNFNAPEDAETPYNLLNNDLDLESQGTEYLTLESVSQPIHGTLSWELNGDVKYRPRSDYAGPDQFTYTMWDGSGGESMATAYVNVTPINDVPIAYHDVFGFGTQPNFPPPTFTTPAPGLLFNDIDYDFHQSGWAYNLVAGSAVTPPDFAGSLTVYPNGSFDYTPPMNFYGTTSFTYRTSDGVSSSEAITVYLIVNPLEAMPGGDPPPPVVANDDAYEIDEEGSPVAGNVLTNDENATRAVVSSLPAYGRLLPFSINGSFVYTPDPNHFEAIVRGVNISSGVPVYSSQGIGYTAVASDGRADQAMLMLYRQVPEVTIQSIDFKRWDESESQLRIDFNPNPGQGYRVFTDLPTHLDAWGVYWQTLGVKVTVNPQKAGQIVHIYAYDVDDPSAWRAPVDNDGVGGEPLEMGDNRLKFPNPSHRYYLGARQTNAKGEAWAPFSLSMRPGDNYRFVASLTTEEQDDFYPKQNDGEWARIFKGEEEAFNTPTLRVSGLYTVWRELHVEVDSMGIVTGNTITGVILDISPHPNDPNLSIVHVIGSRPLYSDGDANSFVPGTLFDEAGGSFAIVGNDAANSTEVYVAVLNEPVTGEGPVPRANALQVPSR